MLTHDVVDDGDRLVEQRATGENVNQAGRDNTTNYHYYGAAKPPDDKEDGSPEGTGSGSGGFWIVVVVIVALLASLISKCGGADAGDSDGPFPQKSDPWPAGATRPAIMALVVSKIRTCAEVRVLNPVNCPQRVTEVVGDVSRVHWSLEGDPSDGAVIRYHGGRFDIIGHSVLTVVYDVYDSPAFTLQRVNYRASVSWSNGVPAVKSVGSTSINPKPPIIKHSPQPTWAQVAPALEEAFKRCASAHVAPLPDDCPAPDDEVIVSSKNARWTLEGDPLLNTQSTFDAAWGLTHVTGSYAMTVHYQDFFGRHTNEQNGTYDAVISTDGSIVRVLQLAG